MFTITLGTGSTFEVTAVNETYSPWQSETCKRFSLTLDNNQVDHELEWYRELLEAEGALDSIVVSTEESPCLTPQGYTQLQDLSIHLLPTGGRYLTIRLEKPENLKGDGGV